MFSCVFQQITLENTNFLSDFRFYALILQSQKDLEEFSKLVGLYKKPKIVIVNKIIGCFLSIKIGSRFIHSLSLAKFYDA